MICGYMWRKVLKNPDVNILAGLHKLTHFLFVLFRYQPKSSAAFHRDIMWKQPSWLIEAEVDCFCLSSGNLCCCYLITFVSTIKFHIWAAWEGIINRYRN